MTAWWAASSISAVSTTQSGPSGFSGDCRERPAIGGYFSSVILNSPVSALKSSHFDPQSLVRKFPFLTACSWKRTGSAPTPGMDETGMAFFAANYVQMSGSPSRAACCDHSAGGSRSRAMPMPRGRRPSIAALTSVGARKAIDRVILIWRVLHLCLLARSSIDAVLETISPSHFRPRAIDRTSPALLSARIGLIRCAAAAG